MDRKLNHLLESLVLMGLEPEDSLLAMTMNGIAMPEAFEAILERFPPIASSPDLARTRLAATVAQGHLDFFEGLAKILRGSGIHPLSMLSWDGWAPDQALDLLQSHWRGPGRAPLCLLGLGHVPCADLRLLPRGLRLQRLRVAHAPHLRQLPCDLEVEEAIVLEGLGLEEIPHGIRCGGGLTLQGALRPRSFRIGRWRWPWDS